MANQDKNIVINKITVSRLERRREDIETWMKALQTAESQNSPRRKPLYELYQRIMLDAFLWSFVERRVQEVTNQTLIVKNEEGEHDEELMKVTKRRWFRRMLRFIIETKFWGHSIIEPVLRNGDIFNVNVVPRHHVVPEQGIIRLSMSDLTGLDFRKPPLNMQLLEVGEPDDLGILHRAAPYVLYKQGNIADWANFCEIFGMPIREYKYKPHDPLSRIEAEKAAQEMGSAAYIIVPEGVELNLHEPADASGSSDLFSRFRQSMNNELAVLILGNQLTSQNEETGAYSLGEIHQDEQNKIHADDLMYVESFLNDVGRDFLGYWGYAPKEGFSFEFDRQEHLSMAQRVDVDTKLAGLIPISTAYFYERYNVPPPTPEEMAEIEEARQAAAREPKSQPGKEDDPGGKEDDESGPRAFYRNLSLDFKPTAKLNLSTLLDAFTALIQAIFEGRMPAGSVDEALMIETGRQLVSGWSTSYNLINPEYDTIIRRNLFTFAGAKTFSQIEMLRDSVYRDGRRVPFTEFREIAKSIWEDYNENWLAAEYNQVVRAGTMGQKWEQIVRAADQYPYLQYETEGDDRVRPAHQLMDGITLPITDPFWREFYPPNGWRCRCRVKQIRRDEVTSGKVTLTEATQAMSAGYQDSDPYWRGNIGRDGFVFRETHPYFTRLTREARDRINQIMKDNG